VFRSFLDATSDKTHNFITKCIADLILYSSITSSQRIKEQGDYWGHVWETKNATYEAGNGNIRDLPYKINNK